MVETDIREYAEGIGVQIRYELLTKRPLLVAFNEAGHNSTSVDLIDILIHVKHEMPELWNKIEDK